MKVNLRKTLFILPNLFTCSSIFCGFYAILRCMGDVDSNAFYEASLLIVFAMFFDMIDGRVARMTRTQSAFGVQLDSLADVVSFGVAPGVLVYRWSLDELGVLGIFACFAYLACGAIRLGRFNVLAMASSGAPKKPGKYILGLPIPGAAGILVSLVVANHTVAGDLPGSPMIILAVVAALSFFMISSIRFRSFKDLRFSWRAAALVIFAIVSSIVIAVQYHPSFAFVWILACYIVIGLAESLFSISRRGLQRRRSTTLVDDEDEDETADEPERRSA